MTTKKSDGLALPPSAMARPWAEAAARSLAAASLTVTDGKIFLAHGAGT
jgi:hypothetical protein